MSNLVLSAAVGLKQQDVEFFIKTLRNYYDGEINFLVGRNDNELIKLFALYNCDFTIVDVHRFDIQMKRYLFFKEILKKRKYKNIFFCDARDIYFQRDPFKYKYKGEINFFLEGRKIKDCQFATEWITKTYGEDIYKNISDEIISCGGTIMGTHSGMESFLRLMIEHTKKYKFKKRLKYLLTFRRDKTGRGSDQAHGNYIAHKKLIKNTFFYSTPIIRM